MFNRDKWLHEMLTKGANVCAVGYSVTVLPDGSGKIETAWSADDDSPELRAAVNALESLILAHACLGINVYDKLYADAVETALIQVLHRYE